MMKLNILISVIFLLVTTTGFTSNRGYNISGVVLDSISQKPIYGATVVVGTKLDITDMNGRFVIKNIVQKKVTIVARDYPSYIPAVKEIVLTADTILVFNMVENILKMDEIIVKGSSHQAQIKAIEGSPMAVSVVDGMKLRGRTSGIEEILTRTSGVKIRKSGGLGSSSRISIHGLEGKRISVFIDGFELDSPDGSFDLNDIPIDMIKHIEVYKGIVPSEYGGSGLGGAINIVTREIDCDLIGFTQELASFGTSKTIFALKKVFEKPGIQIGAGFFYNRSNNNYKMTYPIYEANLPESAYHSVTRNNDFYNAGMLDAEIAFTKLWFDKIKFEYSVYQNKKEIQSLNFDSRYAYTYGNNIMPTLTLDKRNFFAEGLDFKFALVTPIINTHLVDTSLVKHQWNGDVTNSSGETEDNLLNLSDDKRFEVRNKFNLKYRINDLHTLNLNNQFVYSNYKPKDDYVADYVGFDPSGFPSKMTGNTSGLAYEYYSRNKKFQNSLMINLYYLNSTVYKTSDKILGNTESGAIVPPKTSVNDFYLGFSQGMSYEIFPDIRAKVSFARAVRLPDTGELFGDGILTKPSVNLQPEKSNNINLGFIISKYNFIGLNRFQFDANLYYMNITDMITLSPVDVIRMAYTNLGKTVIKGFDMDLKVDITKDIYGYFNLTYQNIKDNLKWKTDDKTIANPTYKKDVPNIPWFYFNYGMEYNKSGLLGKDEFSRVYVNVSYVHEYNWGWKMSDNVNQAKGWLIPSSHIFTVGVQQSFWDNQISLGFEVENLFNVECYQEFKHPLQGRTFKLKLRFNLFRDKSVGGAMGI